MGCKAETIDLASGRVFVQRSLNRSWVVISSPNEGLNAAADINHDEIVNAADIGLLVAAWGDAPRNPMPPSDCPLGLIPQPESRLAEEISSQFVRKIDRFAWAAQ